MSDLNQRIIKAAVANKKRLPRMKPLQYPKNIERQYNSELQAIVRAFYEEVKRLVLPILPSVARDLGQSTVRKDAGVNDVVSALEELKKNLGRKYTDRELKEIARKKAISFAEMSRAATANEFKRVIGVDLFIDNKALTELIETFSVFNVQLSKSLIDDAVNKVQSTILSGFQTGTRWENIAKDIEEFIDPEVGNVANRARLIARDQISTLNAQVTKERQTSLGVKEYIWRTSLDERVRDSHKELEGKRFSWDDPPSVGHPGEDYNCRCTAEPVLDEFFEQ